MPIIFTTLRVRLWTTWVTRDAGQGLTEYALILALIAIVAILALTLIGSDVSSPISTAANKV
jgi:Flp pilus assembly pilin Flp